MTLSLFGAPASPPIATDDALPTLALSLRQPWSFAVLHGGKIVENRRWNTKLRGRFLLHEAKGMSLEDYHGAVTWMRDRGILRGSRDFVATGVRLPAFAEMPRRGGIVGVATLVDVIPPGPRSISPLWHMEEQYGFRLEDVRSTDFTPLRGLQMFFAVPSDVARAALGTSP